MARRRLHGALFSTSKVHSELLNDLALQANLRAATTDADQVLRNDGAGTAGRTGVAIRVDSNAQDVQFNNAIWYQINQSVFYKAVDAAVDISSECSTSAGDTVATSKTGAFWFYVDSAGAVDAESAATTQSYDSAVIALSQFSISSQTLPIADQCCVAVLTVTEGGSGAWTFGTDSITGETEIYHNVEGLPSIESEMASFALDANAATFTYGAATVVLASGVVVTLTGKANVVFNDTTTTANGKTAAYLLYALANDVEACVLLGSAYDNLQAAKDAVRDAAPNPLLPLLGVIYVTARSGTFVAATTKLDAAGIDTVFVTNGTGANRLEYGRSGGSQLTPVDDLQLPTGIV